MELEKQVCSLPLAQRLKELGVKQESFFCWSVTDFESMKPEVTSTRYATSSHGKGFNFAAFTVAELGEMLPERVCNHSYVAHFFQRREGKGWLCTYANAVPNGLTFKYPKQEADTEADARAKMLIYLLENKLITS